MNDWLVIKIVIIATLLFIIFVSYFARVINFRRGLKKSQKYFAKQNALRTLSMKEFNLIKPYLRSAPQQSAHLDSLKVYPLHGVVDVYHKSTIIFNQIRKTHYCYTLDEIPVVLPFDAEDSLNSIADNKAEVIFLPDKKYAIVVKLNDTFKLADVINGNVRPTKYISSRKETRGETYANKFFSSMDYCMLLVMAAFIIVTTFSPHYISLILFALCVLLAFYFPLKKRFTNRHVPTEVMKVQGTFCVHPLYHLWRHIDKSHGQKVAVIGNDYATIIPRYWKQSKHTNPFISNTSVFAEIRKNDALMLSVKSQSKALSTIYDNKNFIQIALAIPLLILITVILPSLFVLDKAGLGIDQYDYAQSATYVAINSDKINDINPQTLVQPKPLQSGDIVRLNVPVRCSLTATFDIDCDEVFYSSIANNQLLKYPDLSLMEKELMKSITKRISAYERREYHKRLKFISEFFIKDIKRFKQGKLTSLPKNFLKLLENNTIEPLKYATYNNLVYWCDERPILPETQIPSTTNNIEQQSENILDFLANTSEQESLGGFQQLNMQIKSQPSKLCETLTAYRNQMIFVNITPDAGKLSFLNWHELKQAFLKANDKKYFFVLTTKDFFSFEEVVAAVIRHTLDKQFLQLQEQVTHTIKKQALFDIAASGRIKERFYIRTKYNDNYPNNTTFTNRETSMFAKSIPMRIDDELLIKWQDRWDIVKFFTSPKSIFTLENYAIIKNYDSKHHLYTFEEFLGKDDDIKSGVYEFIFIILRVISTIVLTLFFILAVKESRKSHLHNVTISDSS